MSGLNIQQFVGLAVFTSYFAIIVLLFYVILKTIPGSVRQKTRGRFVILTVASFAHTWYYMFGFMRWSFIDYERASGADQTQYLVARMSNWLWNTGLFEQAWTIVCAGPVNWWWSEQLCLFSVGSWTVFLLTEGKKRGVRHIWAYMVFGQLVAISVASNLFFLALSLSTPRPPSKSKAIPSQSASVAPVVWISVLLSLSTVFFVPHSIEHDYFFTNLLMMHVLLVIPLISPAFLLSSNILRMRARTLYGLVVVFALAARTVTTSTALFSLPKNIRTSPASIFSVIWQVLHSHPAQSSIGWDIVWTTISFAVWAWPVSHRSAIGRYMPFLALSGAVSIGVTAPITLALSK